MQVLKMLSYHGSNYGGATVSRENFWSKTTTALGAMQVSIGVGFLTFSFLAYVIDLHFPYQLRFVGIGMMTGCVIVCTGVIGIFTAKKRSKLMVSLLLLFSMLAVFCALFPMVIGILGAHRGVNEQEGQSLLLPICQLVFSTVEIVVAAWTLGLCVQALCCPNISLGLVSVQQPAGYGLSHLLVSEEGYHTLQPLGEPVQMAAGHSQFLLPHNHGFHYVPIITSAGMLHGIQPNNQSVHSAVPQTNLSSPLLSPEEETARTTTASTCQLSGAERKTSAEEAKPDMSPEEEREDVCLLP